MYRALCQDGRGSMRPWSVLRPVLFLALVWIACLVCDGAPVSAQTAVREGMTGKQLYQTACAACHGQDGRGVPPEVRGFDHDLPDFTDCQTSTPEADLDWSSIVHLGGRARAFNRMMPAFGAALSDGEIASIIGYVRGFCTERGWPRGDLNLPRPFITEKAFPENEAVLTTTIGSGADASIGNEFLYERRVGRRGQYEINVPFELQQRANERWSGGVGDVAAAYKHALFDSLGSGSIVSAGGEITLPTGKAAAGLGTGTTVFEAFGTVSQALPRDGFLHAHAGVEVPADGSRVAKEAFWRVAVGRSVMEHRWGRAWSPMVELLAARELVSGRTPEWDLLPQVQVSLSTRQHMLVNAGVRFPLNERENRHASVLLYLLWDWFDGGILSGW